MPAGGIPELQAAVTALQGKIPQLEAKLSDLTSRLNEVATNASHSASVPELTDLTVQAVTSLNQVVDALEGFSDGTVSRGFLDSLLP